jgi:ribosome-associated heat shock protein Hsp15
VESTRIDRWLWAVRLYKTRSAATDACRAGHVKLNGAAVKAAATVKAGDRITARINSWERDVEIVSIIDKRVGAPLAAACLVDHSPPRPEFDPIATAFARDPSSGRPTKRDRRQLDRLRQQ